MITKINTQQLLDMFFEAEKAVSAKKELLNNLNVYPVPDGDTGTNMSLTLKEIVKSIDIKKDYNFKKLCEIIEESSLMGARGNSGVILSQFIDGFCGAIKNKKTIDQQILLKAFQKGTKEAYESVSNPVEGTILTIMKSAAHEMEKRQNFNDIIKILNSTINKSRFMLKKTPDMLQKLKDAGVVDAGGAGFVYFLEGFYKALRENGEYTSTTTDDFSSPPLARIWEDTLGVFGTGGLRSIIDFNYKAIKATFENLWWLIQKAWHVVRMGKNYISVRKAFRLMGRLGNQVKWHNIRKANIAILKLLQVWQETPEERYCIETILTGTRKSPDEIETKLEGLATSLIIAQKGKYTKVHFHTNDYKKTKSILEKFGTIKKYKQDDIHKQHKDFIGKKIESSKEDKDSRVLAVINGSGFKKIYESFEGVTTLDGGDTMNPSIAQFEKVFAKVDSVNIMIIPNNKNVFLASQKAASESDKHIEVLKTFDQAQGLTALLNFNKLSALSQNFEIMNNALKLVTTFSITKSTRSTKLSNKKISKGEYIALSDKKILANGKSHENVAEQAIIKFQNKHQLITIYFGKDITKQESEQLKSKLANKFKTFEFQVYEGGQPHYDFIFSLE